MGVEALPAGAAITADELLAIEGETGVAAGSGDVALVRTGYLSGWPDPERLAASRGAGPDLSAARLLLEGGVVATGSDTETYEVQPAPDRGEPANPQPVHTLLLIEHGVYLLESLATLRRELNGLVAAWNHRTGQPHGVTHAALRKECGGPAAAVATADQLRSRIDRIRDWAAQRRSS